MVSLEGRLGNVNEVHANLVVTGAKVQLGEDAGAAELIQEFFHNWDEELVVDRDGIERSVVHE